MKIENKFNVLLTVETVIVMSQTFYCIFSRLHVMRGKQIERAVLIKLSIKQWNHQNATGIQYGNSPFSFFPSFDKLISYLKNERQKSTG